MRKVMMLAALAAATAISTPALAGNPEGKWQVKILGTGVLVDGEISNVELDPLDLAPGGQTDINNNVIPTIAIEYYATRNISVETICCLTQHHATGRGTLAGARLVDHIMILPATVTLKYHIDAGPVRPYVGAGPTVFFFIDEKPGADAAALGVDRLRLTNEFGFALQAGLDIPVNDSGMGISLDAKKYFVDTTAHFKVSGSDVLVTEHKLDPWVVSGGVYFRF